MYEALLLDKPNNHSTLNNLAVIYRDKDKNFEKALQYFELAAKLDPSEEIYENNINKTIEIIKKKKKDLNDKSTIILSRPINNKKVFVLPYIN